MRKPVRPDGPAVILLHGWPYDIHTLCRCRTVAGRQGLPGHRALAARLWLDALSVAWCRTKRAAGGDRGRRDRIDGCARRSTGRSWPGCDWGARTANIVAALWPERCKALVSVSGYLIGSRDANKMPLPPQAELQWWYQFYFATERGRAGYETYRREFAKLIWQIASPTVAVRRRDVRSQRRVLRQPGSRQHRHSQLSLAPRSGRGRAGAMTTSRIGSRPDRSSPCPTITLEGDANGAPHPAPVAYATKFSGKYAHRILTGGIGHNLPQEAPQAFAAAVIEADRL